MDGIKNRFVRAADRQSETAPVLTCELCLVSVILSLTIGSVASHTYCTLSLLMLHVLEAFTTPEW